MEYAIIKQVEEFGGAMITYVFLGKYPDEVFDMSKKEHRKYIIAWSASSANIKRALANTKDIDKLILNTQIGYKLMFSESIANIQQVVTMKQVNEALAYMDEYIELSILSCIEIK